MEYSAGEGEMLGVFLFVSEMWHRLLFHIQITVSEVVAAIVFGGIASVIFMVLMHVSPTLKKVIESFLVLFQAMPLFVIAPILILFFGFSNYAVIIPTGLMLVFPLTIALFKGASATPKEYIEYYKNLGYSRIRLLIHIRLPFALPSLFAGMRVAASTATIGTLASEWAGGQAGLGVFIQEMRRNYDIYGVITGVLCTFIISVTIYGVTTWFERVFSKRYAFSFSK